MVEDTIEIPVQVNGKLRDVIRVPTKADREELEAAARLLGQAARQVGFDPSTTIAYAEPDEPYEVEPPEVYEDVDPSVPYDFEQIPRAA